MTIQTRGTSDAWRSEPDERAQPAASEPSVGDSEADRQLLAWHDSLDEPSGEVLALATNGAAISTAEASQAQVRNPKLEALWFRLSDPSYVTTAIIPVPGLTSEDAQQAAEALAKVGASITGEPVHVVTAVGLRPSQALETSRGVAAHTGDPVIIVVESPNVDPGSIPIVRNCTRSVLLVGLKVSRGDQLSEITELIGPDRVMGAVCLEPRPAAPLVASPALTGVAAAPRHDHDERLRPRPIRRRRNR